MPIRKLWDVNVGCQYEKTASTERVETAKSPYSMGFSVWLGCRDSNPNYLFQRQASYR